MLEGFYYYRLLLESALVGAVRCRHMFPGTCSGWGAAGLSSEMESRSAMVARMFHEGDTMCVRWCGGVVLRKWSPAWRWLLECFTRALRERRELRRRGPAPGPEQQRPGAKRRGRRPGPAPGPAGRRSRSTRPTAAPVAPAARPLRRRAPDRCRAPPGPARRRTTGPEPSASAEGPGTPCASASASRSASGDRRAPAPWWWRRRGTAAWAGRTCRRGSS